VHGGLKCGGFGLTASPLVLAGGLLSRQGKPNRARPHGTAQGVGPARAADPKAEVPREDARAGSTALGSVRATPAASPGGAASPGAPADRVPPRCRPPPGVGLQRAAGGAWALNLAGWSRGRSGVSGVTQTCRRSVYSNIADDISTTFRR
jgi:hypothetical protein